VKLVASPDAIDLWHNARGGYRAQYYVDVAWVTTLTRSHTACSRRLRCA
jgi:hypothetical protein